MNTSSKVLYSGDLSPTSIDAMSDALNQLLQEMGISAKEILKRQLCMEEVMGIWSRELGENNLCQLLKVQRFGKTDLLLQAEGKSVDPTGFQDELLLSVSSNPNIAAALGLPAEYRYRGGRNELKLRLPAKSIGAVTQVVIAIAAAIIIGIVMRQLMPKLSAVLVSQIITPLTTTITNSLRLISGPLVFLSIICGINGMGDASSLGKIGSTLVKRFFMITLISATVAWLSVIWLFPMTFSDGTAGKSVFEKLFSMILNIVPSDIVSPFQTGNAMQIIFLASCVGIGIILLGDSVAEAANVLNQVNAVTQLLMTGLNKLIPAYVFLCISNLIMTSELSELVQLALPLALVIVINILMIIVYGCIAAFKMGMSPIHLFRVQMQTFLIGLTTASSAAAFSTNVECCKKKLGINEKLVHFGVPFGQVLFKPGAAVLFCILPLCMAKQYGVAITPAWIFTMLVVSSILSVAAPPIPGGALSCTMILFSQLGIPASCVALCTAILPLADYSTTACNISCLQQELLVCAKKLGMVQDPHRADHGNTD